MFGAHTHHVGSTSTLHVTADSGRSVIPRIIHGERAKLVTITTVAQGSLHTLFACVWFAGEDGIVFL